MNIFKVKLGFMILVCGLICACNVRVHAANNDTERMFMAKPTDDADGTKWKDWSFYLKEEDCFSTEHKDYKYVCWENVINHSYNEQFDLYVTIENPDGNIVYQSKSFSYDPNSGLDFGISYVGEDKDSFHVKFNNDYSETYGYYRFKIKGTIASGKYTATLHIGQEEKKISWYVIDTPIVVKSNPSDISIQTEDSATFSVSATGSHLTYQWYYNTVKSTIGATPIKGATSSVYKASNVPYTYDGRYYLCAVSNYSNENKYEKVTRNTALAKLTVKAKKTDVYASGTKTTYDGKAHGIKILVSGPTDYTVYYSTARPLTESNYKSASKTSPERINVGTTTVYYYIHDNKNFYSDYSGTVSIIVEKKQENPIKNSSQIVKTKSKPKTKKKKSTPKKPDLTVKGYLKSVISPSKGKMILKWKKISGITGYDFAVSSNKKFSSHTLRKQYKRGKTKVIVNGWTSRATFYVKMRPYKKKGKKVLYGKWSNVRKVKIK